MLILIPTRQYWNELPSDRCRPDERQLAKVSDPVEQKRVLRNFKDCRDSRLVEVPDRWARFLDWKVSVEEEFGQVSGHAYWRSLEPTLNEAAFVQHLALNETLDVLATVPSEPMFRPVYLRGATSAPADALFVDENLCPL